MKNSKLRKMYTSDVEIGLISPAYTCSHVHKSQQQHILTAKLMREVQMVLTPNLFLHPSCPDSGTLQSSVGVSVVGVRPVCLRCSHLSQKHLFLFPIDVVIKS